MNTTTEEPLIETVPTPPSTGLTVGVVVGCVAAVMSLIGVGAYMLSQRGGRHSQEKGRGRRYGSLII